jgi:hypothetical protein
MVERSKFEEKLEWLVESPVPVPSYQVSGLYEANVNEPLSSFSQNSEHDSGKLAQAMSHKEELRLDVDRYYPQMTVSGTIHKSLTSQTSWVAGLKQVGPKSWTGSIWYKEGDLSLFPYTAVEIKAMGGSASINRTARVKFSTAGESTLTRTYDFKTQYFAKTSIDLAFLEGEIPTTQIYTCAHPNHPENIACENLSVEHAYKRSGFDVSISPSEKIQVYNLSENRLWSDSEMHDAMKTYWASFSNMTPSKMWLLFAAIHETGENLGGMTFEKVGPNNQQGSVLFNDSFISKAPSNDPDPNAWAMRMIFWAACHQTGHAFNLSHSWHKALGSSWISLMDEPETRSFMNYPFNVKNGEKAFFADFQYRFSDSELLFMRHTPKLFKQTDDAGWFEHHGFDEANTFPNPAFRLEARLNRSQPTFDFMEPVNIELKLTNVSQQPQLISKKMLADLGMMTVIIKKEREQARQFIPYAKYLWADNKQVMMPNESIYEPLSISAGLNGWNIADPGNYMVQVAVHASSEDFVSNQLGFKVAPPTSFAEEYLAQDFFSDEVGRTLFFGGTRALSNANDILREIVDRMPDRRVAAHANYALGNPFTKNYKTLAINPSEETGRISINVLDMQVEEAKKYIYAALIINNETAIETFGHIKYLRMVNDFTDWLSNIGLVEEALRNQDTLYQTLSSREVNNSKIIQSVIESIRDKQADYESRYGRAA